jgi:glycosyltransferase involved in cell wall biosynthesis
LDVQLVSLDPPRAEFVVEVERLRCEGVGVVHPDTPLGRVARARWLRRALAGRDVVIAHSTIPSAYARAVFTGPVVSVLHDASTDDYGHDRLLRMSEYLLRYRAARVVAVSSAAQTRYEDRYGRARPTIVIENGVSLGRSPGALDHYREARAELGVANDQHLVLHCGRVARVKGQDHAIAWFEEVAANDEGIALWLAGPIEEPDFDRVVRARAAASPVADRIRVLGPRSDVPTLLSAADVVVVPSSAEAHSLFALEALASGAAVVASDIPSFAFMAEMPGVWLVEPEDLPAAGGRLRAALDSGTRWNRSALLARFSIERTRERYEELILDLWDASPRRHR